MLLRLRYLWWRTVLSPPLPFVIFRFAQGIRSAKMTVTPRIHVNDGNLVIQGKTILTAVPDNIVITPGSGAGLVAGTFVGATASASKSHHVFPIGTLEYVSSFSPLFLPSADIDGGG